MRTYFGFSGAEYQANTVLTVGSFDGVHLGHRVIVQGLLAQARSMNARSMAVTFDPHPQEVLRKTGDSVPILTTVQERTEQLAELGVDAVLVLPFTAAFAATPWQDFLGQLMQHVGVAHIIVGHDHGFGHDRQGSSDLLAQFGQGHGFGVTQVGVMVIDGVSVSSTKIRRALLEGNLDAANAWLGRRYSLDGTVVRGDGRGRALGIPTANIRPVHPNKLIPRHGVYAVTAVIDGQRFRGMANIGVRPTFTQGTEQTIEANLFDFDQDIYQRVIRIEFRKFVRLERKFASREEFLDQLTQDRRDCA